jgi:ParB/RepB/Spo0J family partition protein
MDEGSLYELAESIKSQGVMQPILVRPVDGGRYEIIAGERRYRAATWPAWARCRCWCARCPTKPPR